MKENFDRALQFVLAHAGGFADHPRDPGSATMKGVTLNTFRRHFGEDKTVNDLRNIRRAQRTHIYRTDYWDKCKGDQLPAGVDYVVFDGAINSGPRRAAKWLQATLGVVKDGAIGLATLTAVATHNPHRLIAGVLDRRLKFLQSLSTWETFGKDWNRHVDNVLQTAIQMANENIDSETVTPSTDYEVVHEGSRGDWVKKLQQALKIPDDGVFGLRTQAELITWQKAHGLEPDGIGGRSVYRALGLIE